MELILIDGENFQASDEILEKIFENNSGRIKNLYADFSEEGIINFWSDKIYKFGLEQKQTLKIQGKGSVDACLMLDALEYCFNLSIKKVVICGNDKDYIPLCKKLREYNIETHVYGIGYSNIIHFCDNFTDVSKNKKQKNKKQKNKKRTSSISSDEIIYDINLTQDEDDSTESEHYITDFEELTEDDELTKIRKYLIEHFQKNGIKRIRIRNLKKAIRKDKIMYKVIKKNLSFSKLDKSLVKHFPSFFKSATKKHGTTCFISLK